MLLQSWVLGSAAGLPVAVKEQRLPHLHLPPLFSVVLMSYILPLPQLLKKHCGRSKTKFGCWNSAWKYYRVLSLEIRDVHMESIDGNR